MATDKNYDKILDDVSNKINELDNLEESISKDSERHATGKKSGKKANIDELKQAVTSVETLINEAQTKLNFGDIKEKLENLSMQIESCNNTLLKDLYGDISGLKDLTDKVGRNIEDLQNVQNTTLTSAEFEDYQKRQLELALKTNENILNEFQQIKESTDKLGKNLESLHNIKNSISGNTDFENNTKEQLDAIISSNEDVLSEIKAKSKIIEQCFESIQNIEDFVAGDSFKSQADLIIKSNESIIIALNDIKENFQDTSKYYEALENIKNLMVTDGKFEEYTKQQLDFALKTNENLYNEIDKIKENTENINSHIENLQNIQNLALTSAEFSEFQKQQLDAALKSNESIFNELNSLKAVSQNTNINSLENINSLKTQLENLHKSLKDYIEQILSKAGEAPGIDDIAAVISDLNSVQQKSIKQTNLLIKDLQSGFEDFKTDFKSKDFKNQITKISEIYDSLNIINAWIEKVGYINQSIENVYARLGENIDFDDAAEKVDIIYENISALNNWTMKVDNIDGAVADVQTKLSSLSVCIENTKNITDTINTVKEFLDNAFSPDVDFEDISNKLDIVYENLSSINEWASKIDNVSEDISKLSTSFEDGALANKIDNISEKVTGIDEVFSNDMISSKIDLVYENIGLLNEWVGKIDDIAHKSEELDLKYSRANDSLNIKIDEIAETLSNASKIIADVPNLKDKLADLSGELHAITCSSTKDDTDSYIYTLLDIESDFLKLHKSLDENSKVTSQDISSLKECFSELTDDISSISIRTNKLILSADDANKQFKLYLDDFKNIIDQQKNYNPEHKYLILESKIHNMIMLMHKSISANKNLNTAFSYLAEWIDATGNVINSIQDDINAVKAKQLKEPKVPYATFDDMKVLAEGLDTVNESVFGLKKTLLDTQDNSVVLLKSIDGLMSLKDKMSLLEKNAADINPIVKELAVNVSTIKELNPVIKELAENISGVKELNPVIKELAENISGVKELNPVIVEMALELKNNTLQVQEFKSAISALDSKITRLENTFASFKIDDMPELKSMITGVMVQLNTALTPDIDSLNAKIEKISEENGNKFTELEKLMKEKIEVQSKQINTLEEKVEKLSDKFDKLIEVMGENDNNFDIKDVLSYIAAQISAANESINNQAPSKDMIKEVADKLSSFDTNINKIVSYIEEE